MTPILLLSATLVTNVQNSPFQVRQGDPIGAYLTLHTLVQREVKGYKLKGKIVPRETNDYPVMAWYTTNLMRVQFVNPPSPPLPPTNSPIRTQAMQAHERRHATNAPQNVLRGTNAPVSHESPRDRAMRERAQRQHSLTNAPPK